MALVRPRHRADDADSDADLRGRHLADRVELHIYGHVHVGQRQRCGCMIPGDTLQHEARIDLMAANIDMITAH